MEHDMRPNILSELNYLKNNLSNDFEECVDDSLRWKCGYSFTVELPEQYNTSKKYPLIVFLHGGVWQSRDELRFYENIGKTIYKFGVFSSEEAAREYVNTNSGKVITKQIRQKDGRGFKLVDVTVQQDYSYVFEDGKYIIGQREIRV